MIRLNRLLGFQIIFCLALLSEYFVAQSSAKKGGGTGGSRTGGGGGFGGGNNPVGGQQAAPVNTGNRFGAPAPAAVPSAGQKSSSWGGKGLGTGLAVGAAGGLAAGVLGATVAHQIAQGSSGGYHDGRYYYYGDRNYRPTAGMVKCTLKVSNDFHANYSDGTAITQLVYECNRATDTCCRNGCCPLTNGGTNNGVSSVPTGYRRPSLWSILVPLAVLLISVAIICFCVYKCIRRRRDAAAATQTVYYESGGQGPPTMMQSPDKQWAQHVHQPQQPQPQPYYPSGPAGYPQQPPPYASQQPPGYNNYGFQPPYQ